MATNNFTLLREKAFTNSKAILDQSTISLEDSVEVSKLAGYSTSALMSTGTLDTFLRLPIATQVDILALGYLGSGSIAGGTNTNLGQYFPLGYWTSAHTTAAAALTDEANGGYTALAKKQAIVGFILNYPMILDDTLANVWALVSSCSDAQKIRLLQNRLPFYNTSSALGSVQTVGVSQFTSEYVTILEALAGKALTKDNRLALLRIVQYAIASLSTPYSDPFSMAVIRSATFFVNLIAYDATAKQAFYDFIISYNGNANMTTLLSMAIKYNPTLVTNLQGKCTSNTAQATTGVFGTAVSGTKNILIAAGCGTTVAGVSLYMRGVVQANTNAKGLATVSFGYTGTLPALTTTAIGPTGLQYPFLPFGGTPEFMQITGTTETLTMYWMNCD